MRFAMPAPRSLRGVELELVEAVGIEPTSEGHRLPASPCAARS